MSDIALHIETLERHTVPGGPSHPYVLQSLVRALPLTLLDQQTQLLVHSEPDLQRRRGEEEKRRRGEKERRRWRGGEEERRGEEEERKRLAEDE